MNLQASQKIVGKLERDSLGCYNNELVPWIAQAMITKMKGGRKAKTTALKEYRRLNNHLKRETERTKEENPGSGSSFSLEIL